MKSFSVIIPIFNEEEILEKQLARLIGEIDKILPKSVYELILVENGSTDETHEIARKLARQNSHIRTFHLENPSYGQAFKEGIKKARYEVIVQFDIDFWDIDFLEQSLLLIERYDIVIGSKNLGISKDNRPIARKLISKFVEQIIRVYFRVPFSDTHGLKAMRRSLILSLINKVRSRNLFFDSELLIISYRLNYSFVELPVRLKEIRRTRFSYLILVLDTVKEFSQLILLKRKILHKTS